MLTAEDLEAHERLLRHAADMALADLVEAYRQARRHYEARHWAGEDADESRARCHILTGLLADRLAFGPASRAGPAADQEGTEA